MHARNSFLLSFLFISLLFAGVSAAQLRPTPAPPIIGAKSYLVVDSNSGFEIASLNADERLAPASLTKLMSAYVIFRALDDQ